MQKPLRFKREPLAQIVRDYIFQMLYNLTIVRTQPRSKNLPSCGRMREPGNEVGTLKLYRLNELGEEIAVIKLEQSWMA